MVNSYFFVETLSELLEEGDIIVTGVGTSYTGTHQVIRLKKGQRLISNIGCGGMGYGLPAAIGACIASSQRVILIEGEGGLQMNLQELQTVVHHKLPLKIFILNNNSYLAIRLTQKKYFNRFGGIDPKSGISFPNLSKIAYAYNIPFIKSVSEKNLKNDIKRALDRKGAIIHEVRMRANQKLYVSIKMSKFNSRSI